MLALLWQETYIYNGEWNKLNTIMARDIVILITEYLVLC